jgi:hypothetical protein
MEVTKEDVADGKMLKPLVHHVTTSQHLFHTQQRIGYKQ